MSKKVFIVLETAGQPGRSQLIGILRGINAGRLDWELDIVPSRRKASTAAHLFKGTFGLSMSAYRKHRGGL